MASMRWMRALLALIAVLAMATPTPAAAATPAATPAATFMTPSAAATVSDGVRLIGTLRVAVADDFAHDRSQSLYSIDTASGSVNLAVSGNGAETLNGALVSVTGRARADGSFAVSADSFVVEKTAAANPDAPAFGGKTQAGQVSPGAVQTRKIAVIIADYSDLAGYPVTPAQATSTFTSSTASVNSWFGAASRGRVTTTATILGPWHLGIAQCPGGSSSWSFGASMNAALAAASSHGYDLTTYDHVVLWTKEPCGQYWAGVGYMLGRYAQISVDWATDTSDEPAVSTMVAAHELGRNLGLYEANGLACFDGSDNQVELNSSCVDAEYWDQYSAMGMADSSVHALLDADRLLSLGWLDPSESQTVAAVGTYTLVPVYSSTSGVRLLRIPRPTPVIAGEQSGAWTLELRSGLSGTAWDQFVGSRYSTVTTGVSIRYSEDAYRQYNLFGPTYLVDTVADGNKTAGIDFWDAPLQPGQTFSDPIGGFTITVNSVGGSGASVTIGDTTAPTAPLSLEATGLPTGGAELDWQAATDNLGLAHYRIYRDGSQVGEVSAATLTYTDPPRGFGGTHTYAVAAVDTAGLIGPKATSSVVLVGPPSAPTAVIATAGNAEALVRWTAPANGGPITGYTVTSAPGGYTCTTAGATSCVVSGLRNGTPYSFTVTAANTVGPGPASSASNSVTPRPVPGRPTGVSGTPHDKTVDVTWVAPADDGSSSIVGYTATSSPGGKSCTTGGSIGCTVTGLTNGVVYTFTVTATNSLGTGLPSVASAAVTPRTRPDAPVNVTAVASNASALISWGAPPFDGGSPVRAYDVVSTPGAKACHTTGARSCTISGLTNRTSYTFKVMATNVAGASDQSLASVAAMPLAGATYVKVNPNRLVDSRQGTRLGLSASLSHNIPVWFQVTGRSSDPALNIPGTAVAVTGNLTAVNEGSMGYFALTPEKPVGTPTTSTINFIAGDTRANNVTLSLGSGGRLWITFVGRVGKQADVVFDVTGYFVGNTSGATFLPLTPNRILDSRASARLGLAASLTSGVAASFPVTGRSRDPNLNVPASAIAVTGNLTVTNEASKGYVSVTPARPSGAPTTSTVNFPAMDNRANGVTVPLGTGGVLWVTFVGTAGAHADVVFDVTGYFVPGTSGATYVPVTPNRLVDSRTGTRLGVGVSLTSGAPVEFRVTERSTNPKYRIPAGALAVTANLTATNEFSGGYLVLTRAKPSGAPTTSTVNFPAMDNRANGVTAPLGTGGVLWVTFVGTAGTRADVVFDVTGYFTML